MEAKTFVEQGNVVVRAMSSVSDGPSRASSSLVVAVLEVVAAMLAIVVATRTQEPQQPHEATCLALVVLGALAGGKDGVSRALRTGASAQLRTAARRAARALSRKREAGELGASSELPAVPPKESA